MSETATPIPTYTDERSAAVRPVVDFLNAVNRGDLDAAVAELAPDSVHRCRVFSYPPDRVRMVFAMLRRVFPDLHFTIREQEVGLQSAQGWWTGRPDGRVITRITATGTHLGSYLGRPPTGAPVTWTSVDMAEVGIPATAADDRPRILRRSWDVCNSPELFATMGFVPGAGR